MKFIKYKSFLILILLAIFGCNASDDGPVRTLKITSKITSNISSPMVKNSSESRLTVFIDMENNKYRSENLDKGFDTKRFIIFDGETIYQFDNRNDQAIYYSHEDSTRPIWEYPELFDEVVQEDNYTGEEKIAGENCEVYETETHNGYRKIWIWNNIALKDVVYGKGPGGSATITTEAVKIRKNITLNDDLFVLPSEYTPISMEEHQEIMEGKAQEMIEKFQNDLEQ